MTQMPQPNNTDLLQIPGVGPSIAADIMDLGIHDISGLRGQDAQKMYDDLVKLRAEHQDRCILYVFRCAIYYAETAHPDAALLKWWNWKD